jgi:hypothetical protein
MNPKTLTPALSRKRERVHSYSTLSRLREMEHAYSTLSRLRERAGVRVPR